MGRLNNTEFLSKITSALAENHGSSSVYLTQKRLSSSLEVEQSDTLSDLSSNVISHPSKYRQQTDSFPVLIRFTNGSKSSKISTVVDPDNLSNFWNEYAQCLKNGFIGLKKKEKKIKKSKVSKA